MYAIKQLNLNLRKPFKSLSHKEFDKSKNIKLTIENPNINSIDEKFYAYIIEHNRKYDSYLNKGQSKLVFNEGQYCPSVTSIIFVNKTMISWHHFFLKKDSC